MQRLPWRSIVKADRKSLLTALAMSLVAAFAFSGFSLAAVLQGETISDEGRFGRPDALFPEPDHAPAGASIVRVGDVALADGGNVTVASVSGPHAPDVAPGEALSARPVSSSNLTLGDGTVLELRRTAPVPYASSRWLIIHPSDADRLLRNATNGYEYGLAADPGGIHLAPGVQPFLVNSGREVGRDLVLVVVFASGLVGLFSYEFIRSEVAERRREIAVWRSLGMRRSGVITLVLARAALITGGAVFLGLSLCVMLIRAASAATGNDGMQLAQPLAVLGAAVAIVGAGFLGAVVPARIASRIEIREAMEANG